MNKFYKYTIGNEVVALAENGNANTDGAERTEISETEYKKLFDEMKKQGAKNEK